MESLAEGREDRRARDGLETLKVALRPGGVRAQQEDEAG